MSNSSNQILNKNVLTQIFEYLTIPEIGKVCSVSKQFNTAGSSDVYVLKIETRDIQKIIYFKLTFYVQNKNQDCGKSFM